MCSRLPPKHLDEQRRRWKLLITFAAEFYLMKVENPNFRIFITISTLK